MKAVLGLLLWIAAAVVAIMLLVHLWRGRRVLLGRRTSKLLSMAVFLLVLLGVGAERIQAQGPEPAGQEERRRLLESTPALLRSADFVSRWRRSAADQDVASFFADLEILISGPPPAGDPLRSAIRSKLPVLLRYPESSRGTLRGIIESMLDPAAPPPPIEPAGFAAALDAVEAAGMLRGAQIRLFWRTLPRVAETDREAALEAATRLHRAARIHDAMVAASFGVQPYNERAWMSKAGPRREDELAEARAVGAILGALPYEYARSAGGLWVREGRARITLVSGAGVRMVQGGETAEVPPGSVIDFHRLGALRTADPAVAEHEWIGRIAIPGDSLLFVFDLPGLLDEATGARVLETVEAALAGDEGAAARIERSLPFSHRALRQALANAPDAPGAPVLRLMASLFD